MRCPSPVSKYLVHDDPLLSLAPLEHSLPLRDPSPAPYVLIGIIQHSPVPYVYLAQSLQSLSRTRLYGNDDTLLTPRPYLRERLSIRELRAPSQ